MTQIVDMERLVLGEAAILVVALGIAYLIFRGLK